MLISLKWSKMSKKYTFLVIFYDFYSPAALKPLIRRSAELKLKVTNADKREFGLRKLLNFGHTIGHAIEVFTHNLYLFKRYSSP